MTAKLLVRQGGGTAVEVDYASAFTPRKGSPFMEGSTPLIQMGQRFNNGEAATGSFLVIDPDAQLSSAGFRLRPHAEVKLTEDASGNELTLAWMRISSGSVGRRGIYIPGDEIEHNAEAMDCNLDVRGIPFRNGWDRPAETAFARLQALQLAKLNGAASTRALHRITTTITVDRVSNGHLVKATPDTDLDAKKYPKGTHVSEVIDDIAGQAGKSWGVVLHHTGGSTHKCLLYLEPTDLTTYTSGVRISDDSADWNPDHATTPTWEPHWMQGRGKESDESFVVSGLVSVYGGQDDDRHTIYVETGEAPDDWETWVEVYNDGESGSLTPATRRIENMLAVHKRPLISNRVSVLASASQAHLVEAGQAIEVKSVVVNSGPDKESFVWRRVAEKKIEPAADGKYWLHLSLDRPRLGRRVGGGSAQPKSTSPRPASDDLRYEMEVVTLFAANSHTFGYISPGGHEVPLWVTADGLGAISPDPLIPRGVTWYLRDETCDDLHLSTDATHFRLGTHTDGRDRLEWRDSESDCSLPPGTGDGNFNNVQIAYTAAEDAPTQPIGDEGEGTVGAGDGTYVGSLHVHEHGNLSVSDTHHHDTTQVEGLSDGTFLTATDGEQHVVNTVASSGTTETLDLATGNIHDVTLTDNCTFTFAGATNGVGCYLTLILRQDSTGGRTVTWPASVAWPDATAPTLSTAANDVSILSFLTRDGGVTWFGAFQGGGISTVDVLDDLSDVTITSPASGHKLRYNGLGWVNANLHDESMIASDGSVMTDGNLNPMMHEVAW